VTRNNQTARFTIEKLAHDCLDIRELRQRDFLNDRLVEIGPSIRWPKIARMTIERYRIQLNFWRQVTTQCVRVSWTKVHLGGERPWMHCPHCQTRVARLYAGVAAASAIRPMRANSSAPKAEPTIRRANFVFCSKARRSFHVRFRSARAICIGALTIGSDEKG
jgi:hypothetical protein